MDRLKQFFTFSGRINRLHYIVNLFLLGIGLMLVQIVLTLTPEFLSIIIGIVLMLIWLTGIISLSVRRVHDFSASGLWAFIVLIPLVNLALFLLPGSTDNNKYGNAPKPNSRSIKILAAIAIICAIGPFTFGIMATIPTADDKWVYESYCNDPEHKEIHKVYVGKEVGSKKCFEFSSKHFDEYKCEKNNCGEYHSSGCRLVDAPFPWSLSLK